MAIKFITGNKHKFEEIKLHIPGVELLDIDLPEIQELDSKKIVESKLKEAEKYHKGEYIVEDVSLNFECFDYKFPGPLIKWMLKTLGVKGIADLVTKMGRDAVEARVIIGYISESGEVYYFEGTGKGRIVEPRGSEEFGWSAIFLPDGDNRTFGEMSTEERTKFSMRGMAARKLKEFLENK